MFETATATLDWIGVIVFTVTGALAASRKEMDFVGFAVLGTATGIGGGTLRDLLLGLPVFWTVQPAYLLTCLLVAGLVFFTAHIPQSRYRYLLWLDALGLALFAVAGAEKALQAGASPLVVIVMGVVTATFGGVIRDLLGGESPVILSRDIYASAAGAGAAAFAILTLLDAQREFALGFGFAVALLVRAASLRFGLTLPRYRPRAGIPYH
ncbi:trimeric intracellular cation channel family protein [Methylobacterium sp. R2-1]|uniref:trimeric intracellular cation channel family protein n=1 Tax=Methylobacterium sp. R2-1 TaxID=2587064 RepID=UPI00161E1FC8|nr:trimeric intracellular cation channel family protein [Methylobacterium sp. R2-1]MBB2960914.1 putative membrane protein YeiH [Methylobacterium sp. R2-1]